MYYFMRNLKIITKANLNSFTWIRKCKINSEFTNIYTDKLSFIKQSTADGVIPIYRVLNEKKNNEANHLSVQIDTDTLIKLYKTMISLDIMDTLLYECQRQGRISFYMTNFGEEAVQIGTAASLSSNDLIYAQYRESGVLLWRGFDYTNFINQCFGNYKDTSKGRQMPVHYGSKNLKFVTISSPLTTQLPQAVGAAYGLTILRQSSCVACYFGEGAASEGDAHAAFNFAATLQCPVMFICRNNGYAISTPRHQQYSGDGIAAKGLAYGINTIRVDGNDVLAMYNATKFARDYIIRENKPVLIEAMTYRIGHHSTSDDSTVYRSDAEIRVHKMASPILRFKNYLESIQLWNENDEKSWRESNKRIILDAITTAEKFMNPHWRDVFSDVYQRMPYNVKNQMSLMENHIKRYVSEACTRLNKNKEIDR